MLPLNRFQDFFSSLGLKERRCFSCATPYFPTDGQQCFPGLCAKCSALLLPYTGPLCPFCGLPGTTSICANCKIAKPKWKGIAFHGLYAETLRELILRFKFSGELRLAHLLAEFLLEASKFLPKPDVLIPIPLHKQRLLKRGYNQVYELLRQLAKLSSLHVDSSLLSRTRQGKPQEELTAQERLQNMHGAFQASQSVKGKNIWLFDDVVTTGSTCHAATEALLKAGAASVHVLAVARTPLP